MMEFICMSELNDDFYRMAAKVNSHIVKCQECREIYESLLAIDEAMEKAVTMVPKSQRIRIKLIERLYHFENKNEETKKRISEYADILKELTYSVRVKVESLGEIVCSSMTGGSQFYHPAFATSGKTFSSDEESVQTGIIKSTVIDDDNNRITIGPDGTLSLFFNKSDCYPGTLVILIPEDSSQEPLFEYAMKDSHNEDMVVVRFEDVTRGDYTVAFKE